MPNLSNLKNELASVNDIGQITGAMELVATAKLKRISKRVANIQEYVSEVYKIFNDMICEAEQSVYLAKNDFKSNKTLWVLINSNLGLCGGYNSNLQKLIKPQIRKNDEIIAIGNKAVNFANSNKIKINDKILNVNVDFQHEDTQELANNILFAFNSKEFDDIKLCYTKFINNGNYIPTVLRLFPIIKAEEASKISSATEFEPDPETVLKYSVIVYLQTILYGTIIESQISEQASRRIAMEAATKNGKELKEELSILYNKKRQDAITQEISEIISGANAQNS